jgi:hypothetical protein
MTHRPEDLTLEATTACVVVASAVALGFIIYAAVTVAALIPPAQMQELAGFSF